MAAVAFVEAIFPLHDHAEMLVVQDQRFGGDLLDVRGGEFLHVHEERAVAIDVDDLLVRAGHLRAQWRRDSRSPSRRGRRW